MTNNVLKVANATLCIKNVGKYIYYVLVSKDGSSSVDDIWNNENKIIEMDNKLRESRGKPIDFVVRNAQRANEENGYPSKQGRAFKASKDEDNQLVNLHLFISDDNKTWIENFLYTVSFEDWEHYVYTAMNNQIIEEIRKEARKNPVIKLG